MRTSIEGKRHYEITGEYLPSVTTILSATQSAEKKASLDNWRFRLKDSFIKIPDDTDPSGFTLINEAEYITKLAAARGTAMHNILEGYILGQNHLDLTDLGQNAHTMAQQIINQGLCELHEVWGSEVTVYYPGLYAGATDVVGVYEGRQSIVDFKQTNKPKRREWIEDYFLQLAAYAMAHNHVYGTHIDQGVILMCSKDNYFQKFMVNGLEFNDYKHKFLQKVSDYYEQRNTDLGPTCISAGQPG